MDLGLRFTVTACLSASRQLEMTDGSQASSEVSWLCVLSDLFMEFSLVLAQSRRIIYLWATFFFLSLSDYETTDQVFFALTVVHKKSLTQYLTTVHSQQQLIIPPPTFLTN